MCSVHGRNVVTKPTVLYNSYIIIRKIISATTAALLTTSIIKHIYVEKREGLVLILSWFLLSAAVLPLNRH